MQNNNHKAQQKFWRDVELPYIEARFVRHGSELRYARHWHDTFSVGIITGGRSSYLNGTTAVEVDKGTLVVINPGDIHVCNPVDGTDWSYLMFYFDTAWFGRVQAECGGDADGAFRPYTTAATHAPHLASAGEQLFATLTDSDSDRLAREVAVTDYAALLARDLAPGAIDPPDAGRKIEGAAQYIDAHFTEALRLDAICAAAKLSSSYLIRAFKKRYGVAPHEYQTNRRIQHAQARLREGLPIAQVALETGFADQAHFQRTFKRLTAATPGQYRG
ncbi:MAG TPA: AraC family transcriptional regulator [Noviherbaspirillum sp.]|jgi:AraC-like DNA-binding protein|uniref:AraC family transcriptional regulator n=1 Tax=Noviherbaspirillum sp. TaxID=1926288 RepID=UPI002F941C4F